MHRIVGVRLRLTPTYADVAGCNAALRPHPHPAAATFSRREKDST